MPGPDLIILEGFVVVGGSFAFWLTMLILCIKQEPTANYRKVLWVIAIIFLGPAGALFYLGFRLGSRDVRQRTP